jgi:AraC-like DNA-binding protein
MNEETYIPNTPFLKNIFCSIWQISGFSKYQYEIIIPKGIVEIIFNLGEFHSVQARLGNQNYSLEKCFINGFNTFPILLQLPLQHTFFGVQFNPIIIKILFKVSAHEFANNAVDLTLIDASFNTIWNQLFESKSFNKRVEIIIKWIEGKMIEIPPKEKILSNFLSNRYLNETDVSSLSKVMCFSSRHLSRKIYDLTKMNTEELILYKKYLHSVYLIHSTDFSLTEIAYQSKFFDQSHFIKSFKSFSHLTPSEYKKRKSNIYGHIFENVR